MSESLRKTLVNTKQQLLALEHIASDAIQEAQQAQNSQAEEIAVHAQRAAYVAYDLINLFPDAADRVLEAEANTPAAIRARWVRRIALMSDEELMQMNAALAPAETEVQARCPGCNTPLSEPPAEIPPDVQYYVCHDCQRPIMIG